MELWSKILMAGFVILMIVLGTLPEKSVPQTSLPVYNATTVSLQGNQTVGGQCNADTCLTIYVAPWCPACKKSTPMINSLVSDLRTEGVDVQLIIGQDSPEKIKNYAKRHPYPILMDLDGAFFASADVRGVPYFVVTNWHGDILQEIRGANLNVNTMRQRLGI